MSKVLVLRTCDADLRGYMGFQWPASGPVEAPDWDPSPRSRRGLHGSLWGAQPTSYPHRYIEFAKWLVVSVEASEIKEDYFSVRFPRGEVVFCGDRDDAAAYIAANGGADKPVSFIQRTVGDDGTVEVGSHGTATAGVRGTAKAGHHGWAISGDHGTSVAGDGGVAKTGDHGNATAGPGGWAESGVGGTSTAGRTGRVKAGVGGTLIIHDWDGTHIYVPHKASVGVDGIKANRFYRLQGGRFIESLYLEVTP